VRQAPHAPAAIPRLCSRAHQRPCVAVPAGMCCAARCGSAALPRLAAVRVLGTAPAAGLAARLETLDLTRVRGGAGGHAAAAVLAGRAVALAQARRPGARRSAQSGAQTRCPCRPLGAALCARALWAFRAGRGEGCRGTRLQRGCACSEQRMPCARALGASRGNRRQQCAPAFPALCHQKGSKVRAAGAQVGGGAHALHLTGLDYELKCAEAVRLTWSAGEPAAHHSA